MEVADNRIVKVSGDKNHPTNFGRLCTKGNTCAQPLATSGRLENAWLRNERTREPVQVDIDAAIKQTAARLRAIADQHGPDALAFYVSGQMSLEAQYLANKLAKGFVRTNNIESNSRLCMASAGSGYKLSLGSDGPPGSYQDFDKADVFFVIGANMADCHPILFLRMMDRVKAGAKLIVVDPRRNMTADKANLFMQIRPGTDLALLNGLLYLLVKNGQTDADFIARFTEGWDTMPAFLEDYSPEKVSAITGIAEAHIRKAAEWIGAAPNWMSCWTMGLNQSTHGTWNTNAVCNLHLATGAICRVGSGPFSLTGQPNAMGGREMGYMGPGLPGQRSVLVEKDRDFVEDLWKIPRGSLRTDVGNGTVDMFERMRDGAIKACWIICTNPVATLPNRDTAVAGLKAAELVIAQDAFLDTETNRYADILLPGALWAEAEGVMINSERNMTLMAQAVSPPGEAMADWQIIARVACEMGYAEGFTFASVAEVFDEIRQAWNPSTGYDIRGASHERLRATPLQWPCASVDGDSRNPLRYINDGISQALKTDADGTRPHIVFATKSGKAAFFARPHMPAAEMPDGDFPFVLNTGRLQHQWHTLTKTGRVATLNKLNPGPFIEINPEDAANLGIRDKDQVEVRSRRGHAVLPAVVTNRVLPGNCFAPFHWNDVFGEDLAINAVTSDAVDPISLQPEFKFSAVKLVRVTQRTSVPSIHKNLLEKNGSVLASDRDVETVAATVKELDMNQIDALAQLLGLDAAPAIALAPQEQLYLQGYVMGLRTDASRQAGGVPVLPPSAPFEAGTRVMLDGVLAGLFARSWVADGGHPRVATQATAIPLQPASPPVTILWASQTGNVEGFAARCADKLKAAGQSVQLHGMDNFKAADLAGVQRLLVLTSTFGDGDPPDNGVEFWNALQAESAPALANLQFSVLAFGDSNYDQFCGFGKKLDARLETLGAQRLHARSDCDTEFEAPATAWLEAVVATLVTRTAVTAGLQSQRLVALAGDIDEEELAAATTTKSAFSKQAPLQSRLLVNRLLNADSSEKETRQFAFDLSDSDFTYQAGDALGVWPINCPQLVDDMIAALKLSPSTSVEIKDHGAMELRTALTRHFEIAKITAEILQFIATHSRSEKLIALLKDANKTERQQWLWGRQIIDVLHEFPINIDAQTWVAQLKPLQPRLYSIASSPLLHPSQVHLTVSTVRYGCNGKKRGGVCSTFLADRAEDAEIPLFVQKATHFRPPKDDATPMIMVGPGTGIAPFRGFLQEREARGANGKNWLFFGEQRAASDFYYRDEIERMQKQGILHRFDTAFSRDQKEKIYVQQRMVEQGAELWRWLEQGAHFYVCGDATRMAKDVDAALRQVVQQHAGMSVEKAGEYVAKMSADKRYVRDIY
jgi:sulfite reductase (NADPH) flavoprotein alpha-component